ncbi:hypothetical protein [Aureivirga sp. CE67]|uniref:hypothetical protein n=1 Tax=Aureivirga sp. CE67 TaxID=1788983 RepID=UPI0018CBB8E8|nr:hypothetical protein [Aureivirga sp. CE67]
MKMNFDIDKIVNYLQKYTSDLEDYYQWSVSLKSLYKIVELGVISKEKALELDALKPYEKEVQLKAILQPILLESYQNNFPFFQELGMWIVRDWGGIRAAKMEDTIATVKDVLEKNKAPFKRVASYSKVCTFMNPNKYLIYDSRVAYSLNWILLSQKAGTIYFPIPEGRNSKMSAFDMKVLIRLKHKENYQVNSISEIDKRFILNRDKSLFIPQNEAYKEMCQLVKEISLKLWNTEKAEKLYFTEMLLFSIADSFVIEDIVNSDLF